MSLENDKAEASKIIHGLEGDLHAIEHEIHKLFDHILARKEAETPAACAAPVEAAPVVTETPVTPVGAEIAPEAPNL